MGKKKRKRIASINTIKKRLKTALEKQGSYSEGIDILIETTAGNLYSYYLAMRDVEELDNSCINEVSREGNKRLVAHPAIKVVRNQSEMIRKQLRELRLTIATVEEFGSDYFEEFIEEVNSVE